MKSLETILFLLFISMVYGFVVGLSNRAEGAKGQRDAYIEAIKAIERDCNRPDRQDTIIHFANQYKTTPRLIDAVVTAADSAGVPRTIAARLVAVESSYRPSAVSVKGSIGLTQLKPSTARLYGEGITEGDLYDVERNLYLGFTYLADLRDRYGNWYDALRAYNAGPTRIDRAHKTGEYKGHQYAEKIIE